MGWAGKAVPEAVIEVSNLRYRYPDGTEALQGVDFHLDPGETVAVFGANGSGKTTFLLHLLGLLSGEGEVRVCGVRVERKSLKIIRSKIGVLFQDSDDQLFMPSVEEDVAFGPLNMGLSPAEAKQRARQALEMVGMEHETARAPYHLSAGQKRRVALAGVLAMDPEIILLDEPATFLDPPSRTALMTILLELPQAKLIVTHDIDLARELARRAVFFEDGKIAADGDLDDIVESFRWQNSRTGQSRPVSFG